MQNVNVVTHITYGQLFHILYGRKLYFHTTYRKIVQMLYGQICFVHTTYGQFVYMLYGKFVYIICHTDKYMPDDTAQVHNESIDMNYLRIIYMDIAPTGHNISFTERQNLP